MKNFLKLLRLLFMLALFCTIVSCNLQMASVEGNGGGAPPSVPLQKGVNYISGGTLEIEIDNGKMIVTRFMSDGTNLDISLPEGINIIRNSVFQDKGITSVKFPKSLEEIEYNAFDLCKKLAGELDLSNTQLIKIGQEAFKSTGITSVKFPPSLEEIGMAAFFSCNELTGEIDLSGTQLTKIEGGVFRRRMITSVKFPESLTEIGGSAFNACTALTGEIDLSGTQLAKIGNSAFEGTGITSVKFPEKLKEIEHNAFQGTGITSISLPAKLTSIGDLAFGNCTELIPSTDSDKKTITIACPPTLTIGGSPFDKIKGKGGVPLTKDHVKFTDTSWTEFQKKDLFKDEWY